MSNSCKDFLEKRLFLRIKLLNFMNRLFFLLIVLISFSAFSQIDNEYLKVGEDAPLISGIDQNGNEISSKEILKDKKILLVFYRGNWCPYCRKHLKSLQENFIALTEKGYFVLVVTPEKVEKTKETSDKVKAKFSIVHDVSTKIMNDYKVAFEVSGKTVTSYLNATQNKIAEYNANNNILPVPATYIIGKDGKISFVHYDPNYSKRFDIKEILKL